VVIGNEFYPFLTRVPYALRDADSVYDLLVYTRGIPAERVHYLKGAGPDEIRAALDTASSEVRPGGTLWVYFAGHGAADPSTGERLFLGDTAKADPASFQSGAIAVSEIERVAGRVGDAVLVLDTCYNGLGRDGGQFAEQRFAVPLQRSEAPGVASWMAAGPDEVASPIPIVQHGAFTYFVVGALRGWADGELSGQRDGVVTGTEAQAFVARALKTVGVRAQTPEFRGDGTAVWSSGRRLERPPELSRLKGAAGGESAGPSGSVVMPEAFVADLDVSAALEEKACREDAERTAAEQRAATLEGATEEIQAQARATWRSLHPSAEACLGLQLSERKPCIDQVKQYVAWAEGLEVAVTQGFEQVQTSCGPLSVALEAVKRPIPVEELAVARAMLARLDGSSVAARASRSRPERDRDARVSRGAGRSRDDWGPPPGRSRPVGQWAEV